MLKVIVDANVWVSGLISQGRPAQIISLFRSRAFIACCSAELLQELQDVLERPKIAARIPLRDAEQLTQLLKSRALFVLPDIIPAVARDPKDDIYLACALAADADVLITGDQDLLVLKLHGRTRILTPAEFLAMLE